MQRPVVLDDRDFPDMGLLGADVDYGNSIPEDWRLYGDPTFGMYADRMSPISGMGLGVEVDYEVIDGRVAARSPMLELGINDYRYMHEKGVPYHGMKALGDTGAIYEYDGDLGFFSKIISAAKSVVKKVHGGIKKVIKKIPGGKYLIKLGSKIHKIAMKVVRPLVHYVGKYAYKLAPIAALIPGYGTAIAGALLAAGKIAKTMQKYGVTYGGKKKKGKPRKLKFKSDKHAKKFKKAMHKLAKKQKKKFDSKRKELGLSKKAYDKRIKKKIKARLTGPFSGADDPLIDNNLLAGPYEHLLTPARRALRRWRRSQGLPVIPARRLLAGRRRRLFGADDDFISGDMGADDGFIDGLDGPFSPWRKPWRARRRAMRRGYMPWWRR